MRNSRLVVFVVAALATTASLAGAQASTPTAQRTGQGAKRHARAGLLRDVALTPEEKSRLEDVRGRYRAETKSLRESMKPAMAEARAARQKGDSAAARAVFQRTKGDREKLHAVKLRQAADMRAALSPEHQKQFDANVRQAGERRTSAKKGRGKAHVGRRQGKAQTSPNGL